MLGGFQSWRTRADNEVRQRAFDKLKEIAISESFLLPDVSRNYEGGFVLTYSLDKDYWRFVRCKTRKDCLDWIVCLFSYGCWPEPEVVNYWKDKAISWHKG